MAAQVTTLLVQQHLHIRNVLAEAEKIINSGRPLRAFYIGSDGKDYFLLLHKTNNTLKDLITGEEVLLEKFYRIDYHKISSSFVKYLKKIYTKTGDKRIFENTEFLEITLRRNFIDILRFFNLKPREYVQPDRAIIQKIAEKMVRYFNRYLDRKITEKYFDILSEIEPRDIEILTTFWPIELQAKPFFLKRVVGCISSVRYIENIQYNNIFKIPGLIYTNFSIPNPDIIDELKLKIKEKILLRSEECRTVLNNEKKEAEKVADADSIFEINTVLDIIGNEEINIDINLKDRNTVNEVLSFWPDILLPAPPYIKIF